MSHFTGLRCRMCGTRFPAEALFVCDQCLGPLEVTYDYDAIKKSVSRDDVSARPENLWRYREVHERSGAFRPAAFDAVSGRTDLWHLWLEHLLLLSMLQHPSGAWSWGRYLFIYPSGNVDMADADARYRDLLADDSTFGSMALEDVIAANVLPRTTASALRKRYIPAAGS